MIIEFFGAPGAGKTSTARSLSVELRLPLVTSGGKHRMIDAVVHAFAHPLISFFFFMTIIVQTARSGTWSLLRWRLSIVGNTFSIIREASRFPGIVLIDEGLLQRVLSVYEKTIAPSQAAWIIRFLSPAYVLVVTSTEHEFHRYGDSTNPRSRLGDAYMTQWKETIRHNARVLCDALGNTNVPWSSADNGAATSVIQKLISHVS